MKQFGRGISLKSLLMQLERLKNSPLSEHVSKRMAYFARGMSGSEMFSELCFCLMAANFTSERSWKIQDDIGGGFLTLPEPELAAKLKALGHRFPNARARYIVRARPQLAVIKEALDSGMEKKPLRKWFVDNIHGFGYKEASHFLRNTGRPDYAIVDFHVLDILARHGLFQKPKSLTPKKYLEAECVLERISKRANLAQGELDLYLWYIETGKVLK
jgi:N-glycosylase/DNA lyase